MSFVKHSLSIALLASASLLIGCATPAPPAPPAAAAPAAPNYPDSVKAYVASVKANPSVAAGASVAGASVAEISVATGAGTSVGVEAGAHPVMASASSKVKIKVLRIM